MATKYRYLFSSLVKIRSYYKSSQNLFVKPVTSYKTGGSCILSLSLFTWLGFDKPPSAEDELINTIKHCVLLIQRYEYQKAEQLLHVALRQAQQMHHNLAITYIYDIMANLALEREEIEKAKPLFVSVAQRVMAEGATEDDPRIIHISVKLARISHLLKEYTTAQIGYEWCLSKIEKAYENDNSLANLKLLILAEDWYGRLFIDCDKCEDGLNYMIKALEKMKGIVDIDKEQVIFQYNDIGTVCDRLGMVDESIKYFQDAIDLSKDIEIESLGIMHVNLGRAYMKKNMIEDARKNCGYGWRLAVINKSNEIKKEAELCLGEVRKMAH